MNTYRIFKRRSALVLTLSVGLFKVNPMSKVTLRIAIWSWDGVQSEGVLGEVFPGL